MKISKAIGLKISLVICCLFNTQVLKAQGDTLMFYLNENYQYLDSKEGAMYRRMVISPKKPEKLFAVRDYYQNGKLRLASMSEKDDGSVLQGPCIVYYESGKRYYVTNYKNGGLIGDFAFYYPNGLLQSNGKIDTEKQKFRISEFRDSLGNVTASNGNGTGVTYYPAPISYTDKGPIVDGVKEGEWLRRRHDTLICKLFYTEDRMTSGIGFDSLGNQHTFTYIDEGVKFKDNSPTALYIFLKDKVKLTKEAKKDKVRGVIVVDFVVETDGSISDPEVVNGVGYGLDEQALAITKQTTGLWVPAKRYGIPYRKEHQLSIRVGDYW